MYDELKEKCRACSQGCIYPAECSYFDKPPLRCMRQLLSEAADAIEELRKLADAIPHVCECCIGCELEKKNEGCDNAFILSPKRAMQYLIKPRWIPVTERLPEKYEVVIALNKRGKQHDIDKAYWNGFRFFRHYRKAPYSNVTHWMPLPKPPKEE